MKKLPIILFLLLSSAAARADEDSLIFARARGLAENGDFVGAAESWRELCARHPQDQLAWVGLGRVLRCGELFDEAGEALAKAAGLGDASPQLLWQRGLLHSLMGESEAALASFDAIDPAPDQATYHYQRGLALQALERLEESCAAFERAGQLDPRLFAARYARYLCLRELNPAAAEALLPEIEELRKELPEWVRNDMLRLEAGPLELLEWPNAYAGLQTKLGGERVSVELKGVRNPEDGSGAVIEIWMGNLVLRRQAEPPATSFGVGDRKQLDIVRIEWPNGIAQNVFDVDLASLQDGTLRVTEQLFIKGSWGGVQAREKE